MASGAITFAISAQISALTELYASILVYFITSIHIQVMIIAFITPLH